MFWIAKNPHRRNVGFLIKNPPENIYLALIVGLKILGTNQLELHLLCEIAAIRIDTLL